MTSAVIAVLVTAYIAGTLIVPIYARTTPKIGDFPFFYFYLLAYMPVVAIVLWIVIQLQKRLEPPGGQGQPGRGGEMSHVNAITFTIVVVLFLVVTGVGFAAVRWRRAEDMLHLNEWGLGGRGFGTFVTWFMLGGDVYTAYTYIAVPALVFGSGSIGFFAVSYTIMVYPIIIIFLPRLWSVSRVHNYITLADKTTAANVKKADNAQLAVPYLFQHMFSSWFAGVAFAAIVIGALVPAAIMAIAAANLFTRNIFTEFFKPDANARPQTKVSQWASLAVKLGALLFAVELPHTFAINLQLLGGVSILQLGPMLIGGLFTRWFDRYALLLGWLGGMAFGTIAAYKSASPTVSHWASSSDISSGTRSTSACPRCSSTWSSRRS